MLRLRTILLVCLVVLFASAPAQAVTVFVAELSGANEVPPNASPATGFGTFILNDAETELSFDIDYSGLIGGTVSGAHFHNGPAGVAAGIVRRVASAGAGLDGSFVGVWSSTDPPLAGVDPNRGPLTPALVSELFAGNIYFNIHTSPTFPGGEIRDQLQAVPEPGTLMLLSTGILGLLGYVWRRRQQGA